MNTQDTPTNNVFEAHEIRPYYDDKALPELIQGQISKLNELDASVKSAIKSAQQAAEQAKLAGDMSAGRGLFKDKKREAIEGLQAAGIELASAVQTGAQAQKTSFEFQTRLTDITKYLFTLGVSNIAANRSVVRQLELQLQGASEEELSELARQEVASVIKQLKEQEDILRKQEQMMRVLKEHDIKVAHVLSHTDDLGNQITALENCQAARHTAQEQTIQELNQRLQQQAQTIAQMQQQLESQQVRMEAFALSLSQSGHHATQLHDSLRHQLNVRTTCLAIVAIGLPALTYAILKGLIAL